MAGDGVEKLETEIELDARNATTVLKGLVKLLTGTSDKIIKLEKDFEAVGESSRKFTDTARYKELVKLITEINHEISTGNTTFDKAVDKVKESGNVLKENILVLKRQDAEYKELVKTSGIFLTDQQKIEQMLKQQQAINKEILKTENMGLRTTQELGKEYQENNKWLNDIFKEATKRYKEEEKIQQMLEEQNKLTQKQIALNKTGLRTTEEVGKEYEENNKWLNDTFKSIAQRNKEEEKIQQMLEEQNKLTKEQVALNKLNLRTTQEVGNEFNNNTKELDTFLKNRDRQEKDRVKEISRRSKEQSRAYEKRKKDQATLNKEKMQEAVIQAKILLHQNASGKLTADRVGALIFERKELEGELRIMKSMNKSGQFSVDIQQKELALAKKKLQIKQTEARVAQQTEKSAKREADYNSIMSVHAMKRAIGYSALFAGIFAVTQAFQSGVQFVVEYDRALLTMEAVLDITSEKAKSLEHNLLALGEAYGEQLASLNKVALELGRAGIAYDKIADSTEVVTQLAILTGDTIESSASAVASYLQVFSKNNMGEVIASVNDLGIKLAFIANASRMSTQDINTFSNYAIASAKAVGMTIDQVGALAVAFSNMGKNASTVGTNIRRFTELLGDANPKVQDFFQKIGINQRTLQRELAQGGEISNQAFIKLIKTLGQYSTESIATATNGMETLIRDTLLSLRNGDKQILKALQESIGATSDELEKAKGVAESIERRLISLGNSIKKEFLFMEKGVHKFIDALEVLVDYSSTLGIALGTTATAFVLIRAKALLAGNAVGVFSKVTKVATTATLAFTTVLRANPLIMAGTLIAGGILAVSDAMDVYNTKLDEANKKQTEANQKTPNVQDSINQIKKSIEGYEQLQSKFDKGSKQAKAYGIAISNLKNRLKELTEGVKSGSITGEGLFKTFTPESEKFFSDRLNAITKLLQSPETKEIGKTLMLKVLEGLEDEAKSALPKFTKTLSNNGLEGLSKEFKALGESSGEAFFKGINEMSAKLLNKKISLEASLTGTTDKAQKEQIQKQLDEIIIAESAIARITNVRAVASLATTKNTVSEGKALSQVLKENLAIAKLEAELVNKGLTKREIAKKTYEIELQYANETGKRIDKLQAEVNYKKALEKIGQEEKKLKEAQIKAQEKLNASYLKAERFQEIGLQKHQQYVQKINESVDSDIRKTKIKLGLLKEETYLETRIREIRDNVKLSEDKKESLTKKLEAIKAQEEAYVGLKKAIGEYNQNIMTQDELLEHTGNNTLKSMEDGMMNFFDVTSEGWLDMKSLALSVLNDIYKQMMRQAIIKPLVNAIGGSVGFAEGGYLPTKKFASGGLLTGGSGTKDDLYLGSASGSHVFAMGGEFFTRKQAVNSETRPVLEHINQTGSVPSSGTEVAVNVPVRVNIENKSGSPIEATDFSEIIKTNERGEKEKVINIVLDAMETDSGFRSIMRGGM